MTRYSIDVSVIAIEIRTNHLLFQIERPDGNNVVSFLNCFLLFLIFQEVFIRIVSEDKYKFNSDLSKEASKLITLH